MLQCKKRVKKTGVCGSWSISFLYINPLWVIAVQICLHIWQVRLSNGSCEMLFGKMKRKLSPCQFQSLFSKTFLTKGESQVLPFLLLVQFPKNVPLPFLRWQKRHSLVAEIGMPTFIFLVMPFVSLSRVMWISTRFSFQIFYSSLSLPWCYQWGRKASFEPSLFPSRAGHAALESLRSIWDSRGLGPV